MPELKVLFMDAGQGDSTLVVYPDGSLMLVDCGSTKNKGVVAPEIEQAIQRYLPNNKVIDTLVLTHPDADHYNMLLQITKNLGLTYSHIFYGGERTDYGGGVDQWLQQNNAISLVQQNTQDVYSDNPGPNQFLSRRGANVWVLAANFPSRGEVDKKKYGKNSNSVVLLIEYGGVNIFLMGDATFSTEEYIIDTYKSVLPVATVGTVLKVGHHGSSQTSSSEAWIKAIEPNVLFISSDTRPFGGTRGTQLPNSTTIDNIKQWSNIVDFGQVNDHSYVQFNDIQRQPEEVWTTEAIYTNLSRLDLSKNPPEYLGATYQYSVSDTGAVGITWTGA